MTVPFGTPLWQPGGQGAHADLESVAVAELVRAAKVYVLAALDYVGTA